MVTVERGGKGLPRDMRPTLGALDRRQSGQRRLAAQGLDLGRRPVVE
jgi:hypothetical protein